MGREIFDRETVPFWRTVGSSDLPAGCTVATGDPCYGALDEVDGALSAGTWNWDIRDANEAGEAAYRVWEVRLVRNDADPLDNWSWWDAYGESISPEQMFPAEHGAVLYNGTRGVDAGMIAWQVTNPQAPAIGEWEYDEYGDTEYLLEAKQDAPLRGGLALVTGSGWGDGGYACVSRTNPAGDVVEVRIMYITPKDAPISPDEFNVLLPGAFAGIYDSRESEAWAESLSEEETRAWLDHKIESPPYLPIHVTGPVGLEVETTWYKAPRLYPYEEGYDPTDIAEYSHDRVTAIRLPEPGIRFVERYDDEEPGFWSARQNSPIIRLAHLWQAVSDHDSLIRSTDIISVQAGTPRGTIVEETTTSKIIWLTETPDCISDTGRRYLR